MLTLDIGTSSVRAALFDSQGHEVEATQARIEWRFTITREGGAEVVADRLAARAARVIDESLARAASLQLQVEAVAVSCFWHSLVGVNAEGHALTPLYGWADTRAAHAVEELRGRFDERAAHARTGCSFHASYWPAKLLWLQRERPNVSAARWLTFGEFLTLRFCGADAASVSQASATGLFDQRACVWDAELMAGLELNSAQLPPLVADTHALLQLTDEYAARWTALGGRRCWFAPLGDGALNNLGAGCINRRSLALMVGTSGAMRVLYDEGEPRGAFTDASPQRSTDAAPKDLPDDLSHDLPDELPRSLWRYRLDRRRVIVGGALSDGGWLYQWMRESLNFGALAADDDALERELAALAPAAHGLTLLPFWAGERSTHWNPHAHGVITGLTMHTRPVEIMRAALEAVAYQFAHIARALRPFAPHAEIRASGGALTASPVWTQILADVLARPVKLSDAREASSRGAALYALEALGVLDELTDAPVGSSRTFEPDLEAHAIYAAGLRRQESIYKSLLKD